MHRVRVCPTPDGWTVKRPGWPDELTASREWAECLAHSLAHEAHETLGHTACVVLSSRRGERELYRYG